MTQNDKTFYRDRRPPPDAQQKATRRSQRDIEASAAMAEHEEREAVKRATLERLRAERLARENQ